jgi:MFS family permease
VGLHLPLPPAGLEAAALDEQDLIRRDRDPLDGRRQQVSLTSAEPTGLGDFDRKLIAPMILGSILNPVNSSMIAVALIPIGVAFGASPSATAWLVSALYLATATGQPVVGRLVDRYGPRRLFLAGSALVGLAGLIGALAPHLGVLIAARVLLGLGTCAGYPAAMYLIRSEAERTGVDSPAAVLTALAVATQTIAVIGPSLGGLLIGLGGWRTIFAVNVPIALISMILGWRRLPRGGGSGGSLRDVDVAGIGLFTATLTTLLLFLMDPRPDRWWLLLFAAGAAAGFAWRELRVTEPFIDLRVFGGNFPLLRTYLRTLLAYTVSYAFLYGFTQWMEAGRGLSATHAGLILLPVFGTGILVSTLTGRRPEIRWKLLVGAVSQVGVCALLLTLGPSSGIWLLVAIALLLGLPQGLISLANQNAVYFQADPARMGASAGLLRTFGYLGAIVASAAGGTFFRHGVDAAGLHHLATFLLVAAVLFLAVTVLDRALGRTVNPVAGNPAADPA